MRRQNDGLMQARYLLNSQDITLPCPSSGSPVSQVTVGRKLSDFLPFATATSRFTGTTGTPFLSTKMARSLFTSPAKSMPRVESRSFPPNPPRGRKIIRSKQLSISKFDDAIKFD